MKIENREYQQTARHWCNAMLNKKRHPLLVMGGGSGKTKTTIQIIPDRISLRKKLLVIVPQLEIFNQWVLDCSYAKIKYGYINDEGIIGRNKDVYICMFQSLTAKLNQLPEYFIKYFHEIIIDEAHLSGADSFEQIFKCFSHCLRLGLTASPIRDDNKPLGAYFTDLFVPIKNTELKELGYLCSPRIYLPDEYKHMIPDDPEKVTIAEQRELIQEKKIIGDMVQVYRETFSGVPVIAPCAGFDQAVEIKRMYEKDNWKVDHIHSGLNKYERRKIIRDISSGKTNILLSHGIGVMGLDIPGLYGSIWFYLTGALPRWIQYNARAARPNPKDKNKTEYILVDPCGNLVIHGRPDHDRNWDLETDYEPGDDISESFAMKFCPSCGNVNSTEVVTCWICGYNFETGLLNGEPVKKKKRLMPKFVDGNLVFLDEYELQEKEDEQRRQSNSNNNNRFNDHSNNIDDNRQILTPTKSEKIEILKKDLTGLNRKTKFSDGVKSWL